MTTAIPVRMVGCAPCGFPERFHPAILREPASEERYCVDSGRPVHLIPGDRCIRHGNRDVMCTTATRGPLCKHPHLSPNHPYPRCSECGRSGQCAASLKTPAEEIR